MPVVRIDEKLLREIRNFLRKEGNMYQYPSVTAFINNAVFEKLKEANKRKK